jgi:hypothetical protein
VPTVNEPVYARDGWRCIRCGRRAESVHHRIHGDRSDRRPSNLISACGDGVRSCHGFFEREPEAATEMGWTVSRFGVDPATARVWLNFGPYGRAWYLLDDEYGLDLDRATMDPQIVDLGTHLVLGPALASRCELGHRVALLDGTHVREGEAAEHEPRL